MHRRRILVPPTGFLHRLAALIPSPNALLKKSSVHREVDLFSGVRPLLQNSTIKWGEDGENTPTGVYAAPDTGAPGDRAPP